MKGQAVSIVSHFKMGWVGRAQTSVRNCHPTLRKIPKERTFQDCMPSDDL